MSSIHRLPDYDLEDLRRFVAGARRVVTLEEGLPAAGWGASVVAALAEAEPMARRRYSRIGAAGGPIPASRELEAALLPTVESVVRRVLAEGD